MKNFTGKQVCKILEKHGWFLSRINGSPHVYCKDGYEARIVVPVHSNKSIKIGLLNAIFKTAGLLSVLMLLLN